MDKLKMQSKDLTKANIEKLKVLFPNCVSEGKVDFDLLRQELSSVLVEGKDERYRLDWSGKRQAILTANSPIAKTLRPSRKESVSFDTTENLYIEGDNLDVLKLLHETYLGKVKMIYIDPPYNTGKDFVYCDDFAEDSEEYFARSNQKDDQGNRLSTNKDSSGRYHSDWLSMMYMRLKLSRDLLTEDGIIFISIDDYEVHNLRKICDEIFGTSNFMGELPRVTKKGGKSTEALARNHDYLLVYAKDYGLTKLYPPQHSDEGYSNKDEWFEERGYYKLNQTLDYDSLQYSKTMDYVIEVDGKHFVPGGDMLKHKERHSGKHNRIDWVWRWSKPLFDFGMANGFIVITKSNRIYTKTYEKAKIEGEAGSYQVVQIDRTKALSTLEFVENKYSNDNSKKELVKIMGSAFFEYTKPTELLKTLAALATKGNDLVMDFFSGSAITAHAVMQLNADDGGTRKYIMVQLDEKTDENSEAFKSGYKTIPCIAKERIRKASKEVGKGDVGFRVMKLDDSNMKDIRYNPKAYDQQMLLGLDKSIKEDRTEEDVLFQVMLDKGVLLSSKIEKRTTANGKQNYYIVGATGFGIIDLICVLDKQINTDAVKEIAKLNAECVVFLDSGIANDATRTNIQQVFDTYSPKTKIEVI